MKIYLDDVRPLPKDKQDWILVRSAKLAIDFLEHERVTEISLDHDMGEGQFTGYDVLCWLEKMVCCGLYGLATGFDPPKMAVHSANPVGKKKMEVVIRNIERYMKEIKC